MSIKLRLVALATVAVCAFGAGAASAQAAIHWNVSGAALASGVSENLSSTALLEEIEIQRSGSNVKEKVALLTVSGLLRISCTGLNVTGGKITGTALGSATGLEFTGCTVQSTAGATLANCVVKSKSPAGSNGVIKTRAVELRLKEVSSKGYLEIVPLITGGKLLLTEVEIFASPTPCAVAGTNEITGNTALEIPLNAVDTAKLMGTGSAAVATASGTSLFYGSRATTLDATPSLSLASGKVWGAHSP